GDAPVHDVRQAPALALQDGGEVPQRLPGLLPERGADHPAGGVDAVLTADVDGLGRLFDHDGLAERRVAVESFRVDVPHAHATPSSAPGNRSCWLTQSSSTPVPSARTSPTPAARVGTRSSRASTSRQTWPIGWHSRRRPRW